MSNTRSIDAVLPAPSRRHFLLGATAVGACLVVGFRTASASAADVPAPAQPLEAYIRIAPDNKVTIISSQFERWDKADISASRRLPTKSFGANWTDISVEGGSGNPLLYANLAMGVKFQLTGGYQLDGVIMGTLPQGRRSGAHDAGLGGRHRLERTGRRDQGESGRLMHASGKSASYGEMAQAAAKLAVPTEVPLKSKEQWTQIGSPTLKRFDSKAKTNGSETYTIDVKLPGMKTAVMLHPPLFGATVKSFDASKANAVKGVVDVVQTHRGIAVVAEHTWAAIKGRDALTVVWDDSKAEKRPLKESLAEYHNVARQPGKGVARNDGDTADAFKSAAKVVEAVFEFPYLAHARRSSPRMPWCKRSATSSRFGVVISCLISTRTTRGSPAPRRTRSSCTS